MEMEEAEITCQQIEDDARKFFAFTGRAKARAKCHFHPHHGHDWRRKEQLRSLVHRETGDGGTHASLV